MFAGLNNVTKFPVSVRRRGVAQPGRVLRSGRRSQRFESSRPDHHFVASNVGRSACFFCAR